VIGADAVAESPGDGRTFLLGTIATHAIDPALLPKMPCNTSKDFVPVILLEVASGRRTWAERRHLANSLVHFNRAPRT
jgi:tripartite-type tricarboxylate transporter receptor subunit TctC